MGKFTDITGNKYGRLTVLRRTENRGTKTFWLCRCDCGVEKPIWSGTLKNGSTKSCGCYNLEKVRNQDKELLYERIGESRVMKNGITATITRYERFQDVDYVLSNGVELKGRTYGEFTRGSLKSPTRIEYENDYAIAYNDNLNPVVKFKLDIGDVPIAESRHWSYKDGKYIKADSANDRVYFHRLVMNAPDGFEVDHINCDPTDNRKQNLRICSRRENSRNRPITSRNTSGYKGAHYDKRTQRWMSFIVINKKFKFLGFFDTKEAAALAYNEAAPKYHGEFAKLNDL